MPLNRYELLTSRASGSCRTTDEFLAQSVAAEAAFAADEAVHRYRERFGA